MLRSLKLFLLSAPLPVITWKLACRVLGIKMKNKQQWQQLVAGKSGIEIGGPSPLFTSKGYLPLYGKIAALDGVNFSNKTVWEGNLEEGNFYRFEDKTGYQYIGEGGDLPRVKDGQYGFLLSCNNLEHIANPVKALLEWKRIIKPGGVVLLVLPKKESNFDHRRPVTVMQHLVDDFEKDTGEDDLAHLEEVLQLHDLGRDRIAGSFDTFKKRCADNINNRCIHHHVYDQNLLRQLLEYVGMKVLLQHSSKTDHFIAGKKMD